MQKVTHPQYQIPEVIPLQLVKILLTGANQPFVIRGLNRTVNETHEYVLKYRGAERMDESACMRELLAAWLAMELDIRTPEPVIIVVDTDFLTTVPDYVYSKLSPRSQGLNYGAVYIPGNIPFPPDPVLPDDLMPQAARIFAFDMLIQNCDRRNEKPNAFLANGEIYVYDHELSFNFLVILPTWANQTPWIFDDRDITTARNHLFYDALRKSNKLDWDAVLSPFSNINPQFWARVSQLIPDEWANNAELTRIQSHIDSILQNNLNFRDELWKICNG